MNFKYFVKKSNSISGEGNEFIAKYGPPDIVIPGKRPRTEDSYMPPNGRILFYCRYTIKMGNNEEVYFNPVEMFDDVETNKLRVIMKKFFSYILREEMLLLSNIKEIRQTPLIEKISAQVFNQELQRRKILENE